MNISELKVSKYLTQADIGSGKKVTIHSLANDNLAMEGQPPEYKWVLKFSDCEKPMVLNVTNQNLCAKATGSEETDNWVGKKIVIYVDDSVSYAGKVVGGLRIRAPKAAAAKTAGAATEAVEPGFDDDIPF